MTLEEIRELLATAASFDGRVIDRRVVEDWHAAISWIAIEDAMPALRKWYALNTGYIQPGHIVAEVADARGLTRPGSVTERRLASARIFPEIDAGEPMKLEIEGTTDE